MNRWNVVLFAAAMTILAGAANAQTDDEQRLLEAESRKAEMSERLRQAEERMEAAAREIAEITRERLPQMKEIERRIEITKRPRMGVTISGDDKSEPVEGVLVEGVTPGGAADDAGLRAGDILTAVNGESLSAANTKVANHRLLEFMDGVEEGDELKVEYLRSGNQGSVTLSPRIMEMRAFSWAPGGKHMPMHEEFPLAPKGADEFRFAFGFPLAGSALGRMELVELNEGLGKYFGTDSGLLVVSAPESDSIDLRDGDVIQSIDGREPSDVRHALRILSSYEPGETIKVDIMREKKKQTLEIEVPADRRGSLMAPPPAMPARAPALWKVPAPEETST